MMRFHISPPRAPANVGVRPRRPAGDLSIKTDCWGTKRHRRRRLITRISGASCASAPRRGGVGGGAEITLLTPDPRRLSPLRRSGHSARSSPDTARSRSTLAPAVPYSAVQCSAVQYNSGRSASAGRSSMRALAQWALCARWLSLAAALLPLEAEQLRASVGGFAVMNCHLDFPFGNEIPYHLQWDKDVSRFLVWFNRPRTRPAPRRLLPDTPRAFAVTTTYLLIRLKVCSGHNNTNRLLTFVHRRGTYM